MPDSWLPSEFSSYKHYFNSNKKNEESQINEEINSNE